MTKRGFTLAELLVVISILGMLIMIIAPSVGVVKDIARITVCTNAMKGTAQAINMYADKNDGYLPPFSPTASQDANRYGPPTPAADLACIQWNSGNLDHYRGLGLLYQGKFVTNPDFFYCPSRTPTGDLNSDKYSRGHWPKVWNTYDAAAVDANNQTTAGYLLNPLQPNNADTNSIIAGTMPLPPQDRAFNRMGATHVLLMDLILKQDISGTPTATIHLRPQPTWNLAFPDSHVATVQNLKAQTHAISQPTNPNDNWGVFINTLNKILSENK